MADCYCDNVSVEFSACSLQVGSLCNTKFFSLACIAHCCRLSKHSSYLNIFLCLRLSLWGMLQRFPVSVQDFFFGQDLLNPPPPYLFIYFIFLRLYPSMFSLCALPLFWERKSDWLGGTDDCSSLGWSQSLLRFCNSRSTVEGRVKGVVPSPRGTNHSGTQAKHLSCRALIKDLAMYLPYFFTTFIRR